MVILSCETPAAINIPLAAALKPLGPETTIRQGCGIRDKDSVTICYSNLDSKT